MQFLNYPDPLIAIVGPTAVGKTALSIQIARLLDQKLGQAVEIVSADSRLFYRGMDIGTAKPTKTEMAGIPHHLIDVSNPDEPWSLSVFQQRAQEAIAEIHHRGNIPMLVGGTGQYIRAVVEGWKPPAFGPDERLREAILQWGQVIGPLELHKRLAVVDPLSAERIDARNMRRTVRALEVIFLTGRRFSDQSEVKSASPYSLLMIGLERPRQELYHRVDARLEEMIRAGFMDEVNGLLNGGYDADLPALSAIGYREMIAVHRGVMTREDAIIQIKRMTRVFIRRQSNWFRRDDPKIRWFYAQTVTPEEIVDWVLSGQGWIRK